MTALGTPPVHYRMRGNPRPHVLVALKAMLSWALHAWARVSTVQQAASQDAGGWRADDDGPHVHAGCPSVRMRMRYCDTRQQAGTHRMPRFAGGESG